MQLNARTANSTVCVYIYIHVFFGVGGRTVLQCISAFRFVLHYSFVIHMKPWVYIRFLFQHVVHLAPRLHPQSGGCDLRAGVPPRVPWGLPLAAHGSAGEHDQLRPAQAPGAWGLGPGAWLVWGGLGHPSLVAKTLWGPH